MDMLISDEIRDHGEPDAPRPKSDESSLRLQRIFPGDLGGRENRVLQFLQQLSRPPCVIYNWANKSIDFIDFPIKLRKYNGR